MGCKDRGVLRGQPGFSHNKTVKDHSEQRMGMQRTLPITDLEFSETPEKEGRGGTWVGKGAMEERVHGMNSDLGAWRT